MFATSAIFHTFVSYRGNSSVGRASASQAEGREFESRFPLQIQAVIIRWLLFYNRKYPIGFKVLKKRSAVFGYLHRDYPLSVHSAKKQMRPFDYAGIDLETGRRLFFYATFTEWVPNPSMQVSFKLALLFGTLTGLLDGLKYSFAMPLRLLHKQLLMQKPQA